MTTSKPAISPANSGLARQVMRATHWSESPTPTVTLRGDNRTESLRGEDRRARGAWRAIQLREADFRGTGDLAVTGLSA